MEKKQSNVKINNNSAEIPSLSLHISRSVADYIIEDVHLNVSSWQLGECCEGMDYLILRLREMQKDHKNQSKKRFK